MDHAVDTTAGGFDDYVARRGGALWAAAWLLTNDAHHAEDLVQTALSKTYGRYATFDSDRHFEAYVRTTMYRTFVSWWRRLQWRSEIPSDNPPEHPSSALDPSTGTDVRRALASLPRPQRTVLVLRYFEDLPTREIAQILGMPEGTVRSHASRGLAALRVSPQLTPEEHS